jgi:hypothetical protein
MKNLLIILSLFIFTSCEVIKEYLDKKHNETCIECLKEFVSTLDTTSKVRIDTIREVKKITSPLNVQLQKLYFRCDSNNHVQIYQVDQLSKNYVKYKGLYEDNSLVLNMYQDSIDYLKEQLIISKDSVKTKIITIIQPPIIKKVIPWYFWLALGGLFLAIVAIVMIIFKKK